MGRKQTQDGEADDQAGINDEADDTPVTQDEIADASADVIEQAAAADESVTEIDTRADDAREQPRTFTEHVRNAAHDAQRSGDAARHALLHNLDMATGDFKRAVAHAENALPECDLRAILADIRNRM